MVDSMSDAIMVKGCCTELMTTQAPIVSPAEALELADRVYGLKGTLKLLNGERDANFLIRSSCGAFVLKFINPAEDPGVISFQTQALLHIERHGAHLPVPRVLPALSGEVEPKVLVSEQTLTLRTVSYLDGISQNLGKPSVALMRELGTSLAEINLALNDFQHPAAHRDLLWDVGHAERIRPYLDNLDVDQLPLVCALLDSYETSVKPRLAKLAHVEGLEHLKQAQLEGKGVILMAFHFTTLEIGAALLGQQHTIDGMYREHKNPLFDFIQRRGRERHNLDSLAIEREDVRGMFKLLRAGRAIWYAPDQDYGAKQSIFVPLFGIQAATVTATSKFARLGKALVVPFKPVINMRSGKAMTLMFRLTVILSITV